MIKRLLLTGMSGAGKSTACAAAAAELGWRCVDMDDEIERRAGKDVPSIFVEDGEPAFRRMEADLLAELLREENLVIATGGGAVANNQARDAIANSDSTLAVWMHASPEELHARVSGHADASRTTARPMLAGDDPLERMRQLIEQRAAYYGAADITLPVDGRPVERTVADLVELVRLANGDVSTVSLDTENARSEIQVGEGVAETLPSLVAELWPKAQAVWIGVDENVARSHADWLNSVRQSSSVPVHIMEIPSGESSKSLAGFSAVLDWMLNGGVQRGDMAVALGGGVVGDLMGFAASTVLRGIALVQVPTTLLSMVDSSVGGKTGINHSAGKNLIGAFYQPPMVLVDPKFLATLPQRELRSGFAEVIKHGVIQASTPGGEAGFLSELLRLNAPGLLALKEPLMSWVIRQNIALKASVVSADEREAGLRQILNFGHTIGHGVEAAGYTLLHGEAVAVGMSAVAELAVRHGSYSSEQAQALRGLIEAYGLPIHADVAPETVIVRMGSDKKKSAGKQNWVLPEQAGGVSITSDVSVEDVRHAVDFVCH